VAIALAATGVRVETSIALETGAATAGGKERGGSSTMFGPLRGAMSSR